MLNFLIESMTRYSGTCKLEKPSGRRGLVRYPPSFPMQPGQNHGKSLTDPSAIAIA
jgi:hypothetical protein